MGKNLPKLKYIFSFEMKNPNSLADNNKVNLNKLNSETISITFKETSKYIYSEESFPTANESE